MRSRVLASIGAAVALAAAAPSAASAQAPAEYTCPSTFEVLHHDRIGALALAPGPYTITVLDGNTLSCADASELFRQFLEDFDGRLPGRWRLDPDTATFARGAVGFRVAPAGPQPPGPPTPPNRRSCPAYFTVLHNDHIGRLAIPRGRYRIVLLSVGSLSCSRAAVLLARFLQDWDGVLPRPWKLDPGTATFERGHRHVGFRIKPWSGPFPSGGGGGRHPSDGSRCPGTFLVQHNDRIGALRLRRGRYLITRLRGRSPSCARASSLFASFLEDFEGTLPPPWRLNTRTGAFTRGPGAGGFRVKPVRRA